MDSTVEHGEAAEGSLPRVVGYQLWPRLISGSKGHDGRRREQRGGCFAGKLGQWAAAEGGAGAAGVLRKMQDEAMVLPEAQ